MTDRLELAAEIHRFLDKHAKIAGDYNPENNDPSERFNGPDSSMMWTAAESLKADLPFKVPFSSWGSGCYAPYNDAEDKAWHDRLKNELSAYLAAKSGTGSNALSS